MHVCKVCICMYVCMYVYMYACICMHVYVCGARYSTVVRAFAHGAMGRRIDPSWGGPIELFLVPASAPRLVSQRQWYVLSCLWDGAYKRTLAVNQKE